MHERGLMDTSIVIAPESIHPSRLPTELAVSAVTLAELAAGPHARTTPRSGLGARTGCSARRRCSIRFRLTMTLPGPTDGSMRRFGRPGAKHGGGDWPTY